MKMTERIIAATTHQYIRTEDLLTKLSSTDKVKFVINIFEVSMVLFILTNSILESIIFVTLFIEIFMLTNLNFISSSVVKIKHWKELGLLYEYLLN